MHYLAETEKGDPTLVAEVRDKLSSVEEPFERLHSKVLQRQARLQNVVIQSQDFQLSLREAQDQLNEYERNLAQLPPISAIYEEALQQKEDHEVLLVIFRVFPLQSLSWYYFTETIKVCKLLLGKYHIIIILFVANILGNMSSLKLVVLMLLRKCHI